MPLDLVRSRTDRIELMENIPALDGVPLVFISA